MISLTPKQARLFSFVDSYIEQHGFAPSYSDVGRAIGCNKTTVHRIVMALVERGYLKTTPGRYYSLEVVRRPQGLAAPLPGSARLADATDDQLDALRRHLATEISKRTMAKAFARADAIMGAD